MYDYTQNELWYCATTAASCCCSEIKTSAMRVRMVNSKCEICQEKQDPGAEYLLIHKLPTQTHVSGIPRPSLISQKTFMSYSNHWREINIDDDTQQ